MPKSNYINRRKIAAIILIAPLLWIHAVKLFHYHGSNETKLKVDSALNLIGATAKETSVSCYICDYQVAKGVGYNLASFDITLPESFSSYTSTSITFIIFSCTLINSDRAPPLF